MLQGVIDCWFETDQGIVLLDFKTDHVSAQQAQARGERYRGQLAAYAYALETLQGKPVVARLLCFLYPNVVVALGGEPGIL